MQQLQLSLKKSVWLLSVTTCICLVIVFSSCQNEEKKPVLPALPVAKASDMDLSCVQLPRAKVKSEWADPGYLPSVSYLDFFTDYNWLTGKYEVAVVAYDAANNRLGGPVTLNKGNNCDISLPPLGVGENIINMADLDIVDQNGKLKDFDNIQLTPRKYIPMGPGPSGEYLQYGVVVVSSSGPGVSRFTLPCPPCQYCKPPNCDTVIIDSPLSLPTNDTTGN